MAIPILTVTDLFLSDEKNKILKGLGLYGTQNANTDLDTIVGNYDSDCERDVAFSIKRDNWTLIDDDDWYAVKKYYVKYLIYSQMKAEKIVDEQYTLYTRAVDGLKERIDAILASSGNNATPTASIVRRGIKIIVPTEIDRGIWE